MCKPAYSDIIYVDMETLVEGEVPSGLARLIPQDYHHLLTPKYWGCGASTLEHPGITQLPQALSFLLLAYWCACPSSNETWNSSTHDKFTRAFDQKGADWIWSRYDTTTKGTRHLLVPMMELLNPNLHQQLAVPIARKSPKERVGPFEKGFVPESHVETLSVWSRPWAYAAIREAFMLTKTPYIAEIKSQRQNMKYIASCVAEAETEAQLGVRLAKAAIDHGDADKFTALEHVFCPGKFIEECNVEAYAEILKEMIKVFPGTHEYIANLSDSDAYQWQFIKMYNVLIKFSEDGTYPKRDEANRIL
ncbi:hypothetical protein HY310_01655 [Candidatus Microgenomates bacterium]|nr:hypothetical protein [Candidatus Microgenomates bacterium]